MSDNKIRDELLNLLYPKNNEKKNCLHEDKK